MASHKFDPSEITKLENPERYKWLHPEAVADLFDLRGDETLVEYGCGTGFYTIPLAARVPRGKVIGVDISPEIMEFFANKLRALSPGNGSPLEEGAAEGGALSNIELVLTDSTETELPAGSVDGILAINLLHELEGEWEVLDEMYRILSASGALVVLDWLAMERPAGPPIDHCLDPDRALQLLQDAGFRLIDRPAAAKNRFPYHFTYIMGKK